MMGKKQIITNPAKSLQAIYKQPETAQTEIEKLLGQITVIRKINRLLFKVKSEPELFQQICELLTYIDCVKYVWIGLTEKGSFEVKPVAQAGFGNDYLSSVRVTWDDSEYGRGPTGTAVKTKQYVVMNNIEDDPRYEPWRKEAVKRGYLSSIALPLVHEGEAIGALNVYSGRKNAFRAREIDFLLEVAGDISVGVKTLRLEKEMKKNLESFRAALYKTIEAIVLMSEMRDPYTTGHSRRVATLACLIAEEMNLSEEQIEGIFITGLLHDVGKISIPAEILSKPGRISEDEFSIIKTHPKAGYEILKGIEFPWPVAKAVLQHHERLNGSGYPSGLAGDGITLEARILGVADVVEALSSHRPYRPAFGIDTAIEEISKNRGILYDPNVVDACLILLQTKEFKFEHERLSHE